jgi:CO/xanthine dehydrogenase Mo-binding subunit
MGNLDANLDRLAALEGMGCSRKRREDPRFIQGKGTYVDDIKMPGMLFGVMVRSPYARGAHCGRSEAAQAALDADAGRRRAGRAGG